MMRDPKLNMMIDREIRCVDAFVEESTKVLDELRKKHAAEFEGFIEERLQHERTLFSGRTRDEEMAHTGVDPVSGLTKDQMVDQIKQMMTTNLPKMSAEPGMN